MVNTTNHFAIKKPQKRVADEIKMEKKDAGAISLPEIQGKLATLAVQDVQGNERELHFLCIRSSLESIFANSHNSDFSFS
jgi:hypothetical protein